MAAGRWGDAPGEAGRRQEALSFNNPGNLEPKLNLALHPDVPLA